MLEIVLASQNSGKLAEIQVLLRNLEIKYTPQAEFSVPSVEETGSTFVENAIIKARHAAKYTGLPALADDSGLTISALNSAPGVFSSRYAGKNATDAERIQKVLKELKNLDEINHSASFHCIIVLIKNELDPAPLICHGIWEGEITLNPQGENGFGYDSIFYLPSHQCTAAELKSQEKNTISHRGQALRKLLAVLMRS